MSATPKLELRGVRKAFDGKPAVAGLSFDLAAGEFVSLLGPSGCGKSTTLSLIAGFLEPDTGEILVDGRNVAGLPTRARGVGIVFQDFAVFTRLTVRDNLAFGLEARGAGRREIRQAVGAMAERLELTGLLAQRACRLNMSELQRLAIGRALVLKPALLLLDEPMSNLDAALRTSLRGELKRLQQALGQTVLYVTHDQVEAMALSDRILVMDRGELLQEGSPETVHERPQSRFVAEFVGDPPINMLAASIDRTRPQVAWVAASLAVPLANQMPLSGECHVGIRPHRIHVAHAPFEGSVAGDVRFVDNLGAEHVLHVGLGDDLVRMLVGPAFARVGDRVHWRPDPRHCRFFDVRSGEAMQPQREGQAA